MIEYPFLRKGATIGITAPSSGVKPALHPMLRGACERIEKKGYKVVCGETVWTQEKSQIGSCKKESERMDGHDAK